MLNIETMLKGRPNKGRINASNTKEPRKGFMLPSEVLDNMYIEAGVIIIVANAVKNEILVNTLKFFLSKQFTLRYKKYIISLMNT